MFDILDNVDFQRRVGKIMMASLFLVSAAVSIIGFDDFLGLIKGKNLPIPFVLAIMAITLKFVGGFLLATGYLEKPGVIILIIFTLIATVIFHRPTDPAQLNNFLKNMAIIGGLILILTLPDNSSSLITTISPQSNEVSL